MRINQGESHYLESETYPLRPEQSKNGKNKPHCIDCGIEVNYDSIRCIKCDHLRQRKVKERPEPLELARLVTENGFRGVGEIFGVSDNAIKNWCKRYNIPHLKKELVKWYLSQT